MVRILYHTDAETLFQALPPVSVSSGGDPHQAVQVETMFGLATWRMRCGASMLYNFYEMKLCMAVRAVVQL